MNVHFYPVSRYSFDRASVCDSAPALVRTLVFKVYRMACRVHQQQRHLLAQSFSRNMSSLSTSQHFLYHAYHPSIHATSSTPTHYLWPDQTNTPCEPLLRLLPGLLLSRIQHFLLAEASICRTTDRTKPIPSPSTSSSHPRWHIQ